MQVWMLNNCNGKSMCGNDETLMGRVDECVNCE